MGSTVHLPVLRDAVLEHLLQPFRQLPPGAPPHFFVDCTLGGGGHTRAVLDAFALDPALSAHRVLAIDQDREPVERARVELASEIAAGRLELWRGRFGEVAEEVARRPALAILADLGFSSDQLENAERGLSFLKDGPLDMRLNPDEGRTCRQLLAEVSEAELEGILREYGEERHSRRIARGLVEQRRRGQLPATTAELSQAIVKALPPGARKGRIHAATRSFQALRIAVNGELEQLDGLLARVILQLRPGGRAGIISFHSLEDRKVKHAFRRMDGFQVVTRKPAQASEKELLENPRARSAKFRVIERRIGGGAP